jgi:pyruvate kinase
MAHDRNVTAMAVFTESGRTALLMSKARPDVPILAFTPDEASRRRMAMYWGVTPYKVAMVDNVEAMLQVVEGTILDETPLHAGQQVVLICGFPVGAFRPPNLALLHTLGEEISI